MNNQVSSNLLSIHTICKIVPQNKINSSYKMNLYYTKILPKASLKIKNFTIFLIVREAVSYLGIYDKLGGTNKLPDPRL